MSDSSSPLVQDQSNGPKQVRIFMDGAFDMMHFGHMNAFRLGRELGTHLIVGINSDESITECKGPPLMNDNERRTMVESCKFVDQVLPDCPYIMNKEYLDFIIREYKVDYVIHGDDPCIVDGKDVYATAKEAGRYHSIPRTEGISTTDIVGRVLSMSQNQPFRGSETESPSHDTAILGQMSRFLTTTNLLSLFSAGNEAPKPGMKVVYIDGDFDMFHCAHVAMLQAAREAGDYLLVGIHGDAVVNRVKGGNLPLQNLNERVLSVLGCRFVDNVLMDAPYDVCTAMLDTLKITKVIASAGEETSARFNCARQAGILEVIQNSSSFCINDVLQRILDDEAAYQAKFERKMLAEEDFLSSKYGRNGGQNPP